ncbi:MAG TPA: hypothetical protein V6C84_28315, partial [Coleofasciculaceae cyanobacterium]
RFEEYERLGTPLQLNGAICLKELTDRQIQSYLASANQPALWNAIAEDKALLELVRPPLLLSMTVLAYQGEAGLEWQSLKSSEARLEHLLDAYIRRMLEQSAASQTFQNKKQKSYSPKQTQLWLAWLAQQMERESQTEFLIERMQPSWLTTQALQISYERIVKLIFRLICGLICGLIGELICGLICGLIGEPHRSREFISISESLKWSGKEAKKGLSAWLIGGVNVGLIGGLIFGLIGGLSGSEIEQKAFPNQGVWKTLQTGLVQMVISGLIGGLIFGLIGGLTDRVSVALIFGLIFGLIGGLGECIKHLSLRTVLYRNGCIPWNYARFLNYSTDRLLLQRVGGRYRFMHKLLQEHFAAMPFEKP